MSAPILPPKREIFLSLLERGSVYVHLDARRAGVALPRWLLGEYHVVLEYGYDMAIPIPDLEVTDEGVSATLSFRREPHHCIVPWSATYGITTRDGPGLFWPEEVPVELEAQLESVRREQAEVLGLGLDENGGDGGAASTEAPVVPLAAVRRRTPADEPTPKRRPPSTPGRGAAPAKGRPQRTRPSHLKLIK